MISSSNSSVHRGYFYMQTAYKGTAQNGVTCKKTGITDFFHDSFGILSIFEGRK